MRTWVDASTLIALDGIGEAELLRDLVGRIAITEEIKADVFNGRESRILRDGLGTWIDVIGVRGNRRRWTALGLGRGEASLLATPSRDRLVLDEVPPRTAAEAEGRDFVGILGLLLESVRRGRIPRERARGIVHRLARSGFRVSTDLYEGLLRDLREPGE